VRTFIAIDLEPGLKTALQELIRKLKATGADVRWTRGEGLHLTLKFLGDVDAEELDKVKRVMGHVAGRHRSFPLEFSGTGAFPNERSPRVLWVGFAAEPGLLELQKGLELGLETEGFAREDRPFKPHLTLGRVKGPGRISDAVQALARETPERWGGMTVRKISLFESRLRPTGAEYLVVAEAELP
jgi:RNA 2',3'-cyclic 3'-phosphodiesterase